MNRKEITIEALTIELPVFDMEIDWLYSYDPGKYSGKPEDCYPAEEETEIEPVDLPSVVDRLLADPRVRAAISCAIEDRLNDLIIQKEPKKWAEEDQQSDETDRADYYRGYR